MAGVPTATDATVVAAGVSAAGVILGVVITQAVASAGRRNDRRRQEVKEKLEKDAKDKEDRAEQDEKERKDREYQEASLFRFTDERLRFIVDNLRRDNEDLRRQLAEADVKDRETHTQLQIALEEIKALRAGFVAVRDSASTVETSVTRADATVQSKIQDTADHTSEKDRQP